MKKDIIEKLKDLCDYVSEDGLHLVDELIAVIEKLEIVDVVKEKEYSGD
jgi:hypothetical protein